MDFVTFAKISLKIACLVYLFCQILILLPINYTDINYSFLLKFLLPVSKSLTSNGYTVKDSFAFVEEIVEQDSKFFMGSLDADSLFTNFHLKRLLTFALIHVLKIRKK